MSNIISLENVSKGYALFGSRKDQLKEILFPWKVYHARHQALKDISINVQKGEHLGIIGINGSGKSTLLKIISGVLKPTSGTVKTNGSVAALLELGAGFNKQITGRENIEFMCSLSGLPKERHSELIEEIIHFADIGKYIDQPVKSYSSGMFVRLAFAQSIISAPDILIVDEALSVGDVFFQQKCIRKMEEYRQRGTIIFVSHDMVMMSKICSKVIWLDKGHVREIGDPKTICEHYLGSLHKKESEHLSQIESSTATLIHQEVVNAFQDFDSTGSKNGSILNAKLSNAENKYVYNGGETVSLRVYVSSKKDFPKAVVGFVVKNRTGALIFGTNTEDEGLLFRVEKDKTYEVTFNFKMPFLQSGDFIVSLAFAEGDISSHTQLHLIYDALHFSCARSSDRGVLFYQPTLSTEIKQVGFD